MALITAVLAAVSTYSIQACDPALDCAPDSFLSAAIGTCSLVKVPWRNDQQEAAIKITAGPVCQPKATHCGQDTGIKAFFAPLDQLILIL